MLLKLNKDDREYLCDFTTRLDEYAHIVGLKYYEVWHHYIYVSARDIKDKCLCVRIPGGTVGCIIFDENNIITDMELDTNYVVKTYDRNTLKKLKREFIGAKIEFEEIPEER